MPDLEEWPDSEKLMYEKELVGFYVTGHPLSKFEDILRLYTTETSSTIVKYKEQEQKKAQVSEGFSRHRDEGVAVRMGGMIADVRTIITRKGDKMAFVRVEDLDGVMEVTIFPKSYESYKEFLIVDQPVFIEGKATLNRRNDVMQVLANKIVDLSMAPGMYANCFSVKVGSDVNVEIIKKLAPLFHEYHGDCKVMFHLRLGACETVNIEISEDFWVNPHIDLKNKVEQLVGPDSVVLEN